MLVVRLILILFIIPLFTHAAVVINEIMYDLKDGLDTGREWIEIFNSGTETVNFLSWKFFEADTNHGFTAYQGGDTLPAGAYAVIVSDPAKFLNDWPGFQGIIFDSSWSSFSNTGETLALKNGDIIADQVAYSSDLGANGDGNSLQKIDNQWIAASPTPGAQNNQSQNTQSSSEEQVNQGSSSWPVEPQIFANAGSDKTSVAGADVIFSGQALGLNKELLENARYVWSFGDGGRAEGKSVKHIYKYPSEYIAVLNVSSGEYSASDIVLVKIIPNQLTISQANKDFIKLQNDSGITLDISGWFLRGNNVTFRFPETTLIKAKSSLPIPAEISKLEINKNIEILYPNGSVAYSYINTNTNSTTVVESKPVEIKKSEVKTESFDLSTSTEDQVANPVRNNVSNGASVITATENNFPGAKKWLWIILGLGIFSGVGFVFIRSH
ncbi:MAG: lamin tail domain-containing protein [Candidatus Terrybacteria bacterium]|nr:lamin tail domain-containing protein [Candidatus Terrybacteria bacterium]